MLPSSIDTPYLSLSFLQTSLIPRKAGSSLPYHLWVSGWDILWQAACCSSWNWTSTWALCQMLEEQPAVTQLLTFLSTFKHVTIRLHVSHRSKCFIQRGWLDLPTLGLGLSTISKPLISRAQFSCSRAAHGTVREIVWMNPAITSKGASAVSRSSLSDWERKENAQVSPESNKCICCTSATKQTYPFIQWHLCKCSSALIEV